MNEYNTTSEPTRSRWWWPILGAAGTAALWRWFNRNEKPEPTFQDWVVVVTGASSGIGRAAAIAFAERGAHVVLVARRVQRLNQLADELVHLAPSTLVIQADVSQTQDLEQVAEQVEETYGRVDVLINNAGVSLTGRYNTTPTDKIGQVMDVNLYAPMYLTRLLLPLMMRGGGGHLLFVSSVTSRVLPPGVAVYASTKAGLEAFAQSLRYELRGANIGVSTIIPAFTRTPMITEGNRREVRQHLKREGMWFPGIGLDEPEDVARAMVDAVLRKRSQVIMGGPSLRTMVFLSRIFPSLLDQIYSGNRAKKALQRSERN